jgi:hypothetical protein
MKKKKTAAIAAALPALFAVETHAARPMITDDARIVDPKACQVESWVKRGRGSTEFWALPACNPTGNAELTFGGALTRENGDDRFTDHLVQAKTIFRPLETNGWGAGLAVGTIRHPRREVANGWPGDAYFYVPVSISYADDFWVLHLNAGVVHRRDDGRNVPTWGIGNEVRLRDDLFFIPEVFHTEAGRPFYQVGMRYWIVKDRLQMDATFGNRAVSATADRWFSLGLRILSPPFLP